VYGKADAAFELLFKRGSKKAALLLEKHCPQESLTYQTQDRKSSENGAEGPHIQNLLYQLGAGRNICPAPLWRLLGK
jgi:hypothetical protein